MLPFDPHSLSLVVRWVHVASMALLLGGAILLWGLGVKARALPPAEQNRLLLFVAERYELFFWAAIGLLVITGVGNLGALGMALPYSGTTWGGRFVLKLALILSFVPLSLVRTLLIVRLAAAEPADDAVLATPLRNVYALTTLYAVTILFMAVSLAHGG